MNKIMKVFSFWGTVWLTGLLTVPFWINTQFKEVLGLSTGLSMWVVFGLFPLEIIGRLRGTTKGNHPAFTEFLAITVLGFSLNTAYVYAFMYIFN